MAWEDLTNGPGGGILSGMPLYLTAPAALGQSRLNKQKRHIEKAQMQEAYRRSIDSTNAFNEHSDIKRQQLQQNMARRGLGNSSIATQQSDQFERDYNRGAAVRSYEQEAARQRLSLYRKQRAFKRRMGPLLFIDQLGQRLAQAIGMAGGVGGPEAQAESPNHNNINQFGTGDLDNPE